MKVDWKVVLGIWMFGIAMALLNIELTLSDIEKQLKSAHPAPAASRALCIHNSDSMRSQAIEYEREDSK